MTRNAGTAGGTYVAAYLMHRAPFLDASSHWPSKWCYLAWVSITYEFRMIKDDEMEQGSTDANKNFSVRESPNKPSVMRESPQHLIRAAHEPDELFRL